MVTLFRIQTQGLLLLTALVLGLTACESKKNDTVLNAAGEEIFSNRPVAFKNFFAVVKLKKAPLFETAEVKNGKAIVTPDQVKAIDEEQAAFLAEVAKISSEIKIVYKYRFVLNGFALTGPTSALEKLKSIVLVASVETDGGFKRPLPMSTQTAVAQANTWKERNSAKFIGAENLHARSIKNARGEMVPLNGTGMSVAVLDTGIDYTHAMLGGSGSADEYKSIDPSKPSSAFPNKKVVGGIDLVGTDYNAASIDFAKHIPQPDGNPLDEGGHGSHVAGSIAGVGDGVDTYSGVAPGADLYAVKVFGANGSTSDSVVIAGLEYSADPNGDGSNDDQIDVVNMSLGSSFGNAKILYNEAIGNLSRGGTVVVASAGNEGNVDYITGAPAISDEAISVAASVDNTDHNWQVRAVKFILPTLGPQLAEAVEAAITKSINEAGPVKGALVYAGLGDKDFSDDLKAQLKGRVAFMDRGVVAFSEKIRRAQEAGAIGVVVANNAPGAAFTMGGDGKYDIPAIMVTQEMGATLKAELAKGEVVIEFMTSEMILKPELIDTITDFSSKGPRSEDSMIKPEISSPGSNIISAEMGGGRKGVKMSGTSMAGPHVAGAMALLKQAHPNLSASDLKALLLNRAKTITDAQKNVYPISRQGSGRVQIDESVDAKTVIQPSTLSLGEVAIETRKTMKRTITVRNISQDALDLTVSLVKRGEGLALRSVPALKLAAGEEKSVTLSMLLDASGMKDELVREMDGWVILSEGQKEIARVPVLAVARKVSSIQASSLVVESGRADAAGSAASVTLTNSGKNAGDALLFNLLANDTRKSDPHHDRFASKGCDLQSVGYRIIEKVIDGQKTKVLQIAAKVYEPLTQWNMCELTVLIDSNGDQEPEQELAAISLGNVPGLSTPQTERQFASVLFDAAKVRELRRKFEADSATSTEKVEENYSTAVLGAQPLKPIDHSTIMIVEADVSLLARRPTGELAIKVATQEFSGSSVESDDFLGNSALNWLPLSVNEAAQSYAALPEKVTVKAGETVVVDFEKGYAQQPLMVLLPNNLTVFSDVLEDSQQILLTPKFEEPQP
ncbi:MAG: S8 family serine peptidase [Bdellovibrionaceae bacterium]|nr:S8 family serine peptidase [Pseudobdellovibrionaceae bacterium]